MSTQNIIFTVIAVAIIIIVVWVGGTKKAPIASAPVSTSTVETNIEKKIDVKSETNTIKKMTTVTMTTNQGAITFELFGDLKPKTVENFTKLAKEGFYNGTRFHRVIKGFMIQGGDPLSKDVANQPRWGTGGPGYQFEDEIRTTISDPVLRHIVAIDNYNVIGTIAMANSGPNTNGSQFFINTANNNFLDTKHTVFGKVIAGIDVVSAIENNKTGQNDRPVEDMIILKIEVK